MKIYSEAKGNIDRRKKPGKYEVERKGKGNYNERPDEVTKGICGLNKRELRKGCGSWPSVYVDENERAK